MEVVIQFALLGAATGGLVALVALGVVITYRASGALNLAIGAIGAFSAFLCYELRDHHGVPWPLALAAGVGAGALLGLLTQHLVVNWLREASNLTKLIGSLGMLLLILGTIELIWPMGEESAVNYPSSILPTKPVHITDTIVIGEDRIILLGAALIIAVGLGAVLKKTMFGLVTTAVAEDREVAAIGGWSPAAIERVNFVIAGVLAAAAAIFMTPIVGLDATALTLLIIPAVAAALVGRFTSLIITVLAALGIGILQAELSRYQPDIAGWFGFAPESLSGLPAAVPMLVIIVVTVWSGRLRSARGDLIVRQPLPGDGRIRLGLLIPGVALLGAWIMVAGPGWSESISFSLILAILVLSVVVVTGMAGQLSLAQFALAGFGAWVAAKTYSDLHVSFLVSVLSGIFLTIPLGLLVALPALRTRGVTLAIATLGFAIMLQALVFNNGSLAGGISGIKVADPTLFGLQLNPVENPEAYNWFILGCFLVSALLVSSLRRGRTGRRLLAVRSNERAAASLGVGIFGAKLYAFAVASGIAALSGVLLAFRHEYVQFQGFTVLGSFTAVQYAVMGGIGWVAGAPIAGLFAAGGILQRLAREVFNVPPTWVFVIAGGAVLIQLRARPDGIAAGMSQVGRSVGRRLSMLSVPRRTAAAVNPTPIVADSAAMGPAAPSAAAADRSGSPAVAARAKLEPATLEVRDLTVRFGAVVALKDVSLRVTPGEVVGLIGPNGAGKTTLMDAVTGFTPASQGSVTLDDKSIDKWTPERRARAGIGRSWQGVELFNELTVRDNLLVAADDYHAGRYLSDLVYPGRRRRSPVMDRVVADFELGEWLDLLPPALPHGIQHLVGIARAICAEPAVLLLDEPAAGLDQDERGEVAGTIRRICADQGIGILLVEHDVPLVMSTCDRIVVLDFGNLIAEGTPEEVAENPRVVEAYLGEDNPAAASVGAEAEGRVG